MAQQYPPGNPGLAGPAMPRGGGLEPPEMAVVRGARQRFESAKREVAIKADTAARYWKAWEDSRKRMGPAGDPALRRTANTEMMLWKRQVDSIVTPAARDYANAIAQAVRAGRFSLQGSDSAEGALRRLLDLEALAQGVGDEVLIAPNQWAGVLDRVAEYALRLCATGSDPRGFKLAIMCLEVANMFQAQHAPAIRRVQALVDEMNR